VSWYLNNWENHRLDCQYENNLIVKWIVFQVVNSFASLVFIAFFKPLLMRDRYGTEDQEEIDNQVLKELQIQLTSLFLTLIIIQNIAEVVKGPLKHYIKGRFKRHSTHDHTRTKSQPDLGRELQSFKNADLGEAFYPYTMEQLQEDAEIQVRQPAEANTMDNMRELIIEQGYATMFAIAFPIAPLLALCNNFVELRVDTYTLRVNQRPIPYAGHSVGLWGEVLRWFAGISVVTNWFLYIFRTHQVKDVSGIDNCTLRLVCFFVGLFLIYFLLFVVNFLFLSTPDGIIKHLRRAEEIEKFLIIKGLKQATRSAAKLQLTVANLQHRLRSDEPLAVETKYNPDEESTNTR